MSKKALWIKSGWKLQYINSDNGEDEDEGYQSLGSQDTSNEEEEEKEKEEDDVEEIPLAKGVKKIPRAKGVKETPPH